MNTANIVILIIVLAIGGLAVANWVAARERAEAERRHRVAMHRGAVREAQEMLDLGNLLPLDINVRDVLLDYISLHLQAMKQIDPRVDTAATMQWAEETRRQPPHASGDSALKLPAQSEELTALRSQLHRLTEYIAKLRREPRLDGPKVLQAFKYLARLRLRCDVEGHIKLGQLAMLQQKVPLARQYYKYAYERLVKENISDSYVQEQLSVLEEAMKEVRLLEPKTEEGEQATDTGADDDFDPTFQIKKKW